MMKLFYHQKGKTHRRVALTLLILLLSISGQGYYSPLPVSAIEEPAFIVTTNYDINFVPGNDYVTIVEVVNLEAKNRDYFYPAQGERSFILPDFTLDQMPEERAFKLNSLSVTDERGIELDIRSVEQDEGIEIFVPEVRDVTYWNTERFTLSYNTHELVNNVGNITNLYIPGLPEGTTFTSVDERFGLVTEYIFNTNLTVPDTAPVESFIMPQGGITIIEGNSNNRIYSVSAEARVGTTAWIQLGTEQYFYFKLVQEAPKTDNIIPESVNDYSNLLSTNIYELPLPREHAETDQEIFFTQITPSPSSIRRDDEGNLLATFEVPANVNSQIIIEGYIKLAHTGDNTVSDKNLDQYFDLISTDPSLTSYTEADIYWESESEAIKELAGELSADSKTVLELINRNYDDIIERFDYSYSKVEGDNPRLGALAALNGGPAVCMEYADSLIALLRAQGIPARAAIGYGNDPTGAENRVDGTEASVQNIGHQWVQVWLPDHGWLSVDPTWGESGRRYIGGNLDHILWYTIGNSDQGFIGTSLSSADPITAHVLTSYDVYLKALTSAEFDSAGELTTLSELLEQYEGIEIDPISVFLKTTSLGKLVVIILPVVVLLVGVILITTFFSAIKKVRQKEEV